MPNHCKIPPLLGLLTIITGCWLSKVQKEAVDYPYQALSESEVKERAGIPDSVRLGISYEKQSISVHQRLDTSFNGEYIGQVQYINNIMKLAQVKAGYGMIGRRARRWAFYGGYPRDSVREVASKLFGIIDTQLAKGYKDHVISPEEYQAYFPRFLEKYSSPRSAFTKPDIQTEKRSDSLKKSVSVEISFKAREKVDSFYYHKNDTLITKKDIKRYGDLFYARTKQTIRFGFHDDDFVKVWLDLKVDGEWVESENANMGTSEADIEYEIE